MRKFEWNGYTIKEVDSKEADGKFSGVYVRTVDEELPQVFNEIEEGCYKIEGVDQYFKIDDSMLEYPTGEREIKFPMMEESVIRNFLDGVEERKYQELIGSNLSEVIEFNNDIDNELVFDRVATLKKYYNKKIRVIEVEENRLYSLELDGVYEADIVYDPERNKYSAYDGEDGYKWAESLKGAIKIFMDVTLSYPTDVEYYEPSCSNCGDGGCVYCEPNRFI